MIDIFPGSVQGELFRTAHARHEADASISHAGYRLRQISETKQRVTSGFASPPSLPAWNFSSSAVGTSSSQHTAFQRRRHTRVPADFACLSIVALLLSDSDPSIRWVCAAAGCEKSHSTWPRITQPRFVSNRGIGSTAATFSEFTTTQCSTPLAWTGSPDGTETFRGPIRKPGVLPLAGVPICVPLTGGVLFRQQPLFRVG